MEDYLWYGILIFIFILSFKLFIKQRFITLNIMQLIKQFNFRSISDFCMFLGTKIGVGSLVGTTMAIYVGGYSSIVWMILFSLISTPIVYQEAKLGFEYREKVDGSFISGPNFYMKSKLFKKLYITLFLISYTFLFMMVQTNTIVSLIEINIDISKIILFVVFFILLTLLVTIDLNIIITLLNKLVIFMFLFTIFLIFYVIIKEFLNLSYFFGYILVDLFSGKSILCGFIPSALISIKRSVFQSELLLGTTSISSALGNNDAKSAASTAVIAYYFVSIVFPIGVTILIGLFDVKNSISVLNYYYLLNDVFLYHFGALGAFILIILTLLFALTTIIGAYYFGINNVKRLNIKFLNCYKFLLLAFSLCGILICEGIIWEIVDISIVILMIINLAYIFKLKE